MHLALKRSFKFSMQRSLADVGPEIIEENFIPFCGITYENKLCYCRCFSILYWCNYYVATGVFYAYANNRIVLFRFLHWAQYVYCLHVSHLTKFYWLQKTGWFPKFFVLSCLAIWTSHYKFCYVLVAPCPVVFVFHLRESS